MSNRVIANASVYGSSICRSEVVHAMLASNHTQDYVCLCSSKKIPTRGHDKPLLYTTCGRFEQVQFSSSQDYCISVLETEWEDGVKMV